MAVADSLSRLGGVATRDALIRATSRADVDAAVAAGEVVVRARGRYALPAVDAARGLAHELSATLSHRHAAAHWGWAVKSLPELPDVIVPGNRRLSAEQARQVTVHRATLTPDDVVGGVTSRERTVVDCLRRLPGDEALAVADSCLRDGQSPGWLAAVARDVRGAGAGRVRHVAALANAEAANPFESVLRWIAHDIEGLSVRPQVEIHDPVFLARPDLVDEELRIVLEADSFEWHGGRAQLARDARRYNDLVVRGWLVLRFSWEEVMFHPDRVRATIIAAVFKRTEVLCRRCGAA